jgi:flagellar M-ring protein FliF
VNPRMNSALGRAKESMAAFTTGQKAMLVVAVLALALGAIGLTRWVAQPSYTVLFGNLTGTDANAIVEQLQASNVPYQLTDGGTTVLVPQAKVYDLRVQMSGKGLPAGDTQTGYTLLDKQGITATDFQQNVAYRRALEGEMSKTLQAITGVRTAVVHLALPKKDVFATEQDKPTASVLLDLQPGLKLSSSQVRSITHLVAGGIEGLDPNDVTVSDANGNLLSAPEIGAGGGAAAANEADQQTAQYEDRLSSTVQDMLDKVLGPGRSVVRVNAQLDYSAHDTTSETYVSPSSVAPLSEATASETWNGGNGSNGGALGQTFPTLTGTGSLTAGANYLHNQRTVNNAVGKIVDRTQAAPGAVQRMTVAVVLDAKTAGTVDPNQVQALVANAVGLNSARGDSVQIDKIPFDSTAAAEAKKELAAAQAQAATAGYVDLGKKAGLGLLVLVIAFLLLRRGKRDPAIEALVNDLPDDENGPALLSGAERQAIEGITMPELPALEEEDSVTRDQLRDEVAELVDSQPDDVAAMLQSWLMERDG